MIYQPGSGKQRPQVWLRSPNGTHNTGVTQVFKMADDSERRLPLENELDAMVRGMSSTWDTREDALVKAVEDGKYLWAEVDLDHYKDSLSRCMKLMNDYSETSSLRSTMKGEIEALNTRSSRSGVVHDELVGPSGFMTTPQY